jgi:acyl-CoA hydrolase
MEHFRLVRPEHMNHYGFLFGGYLLQWIDEIAYITAAVEFPEHRFVTVAMDNVEFRERIQIGEVLRLCVDQTHVGTTSVRYRIQAFGTVHSSARDTALFETGIAFVNVDDRGQKTPIRPQ